MSCRVCGQEHGPGESCGTFISGSGSGAGTGTAPGTRDQEELVGQLIGSFRVVRPLGRGGMGTVYLAEHAVIGSKVAIKVMHAHLSLDPEMIGRFRDEARATSLIGHESIVSIFDLGTLPSGRHYLVMEYLEGEPLSALTGKVEVPRAVDLLAQLCDALAAAHRAGIVHRDLKPENVFVMRRNGREVVKVLDFGVARLMDRDPQRQTLAGTIVGTPEYMAPEQAAGRPVDARADLYTLGVMAYELLTGTLPFAGGWTEVLIAHQTRPPPPLESRRAGLPPALCGAVLRALAKTPEARFASAEELGGALRAAAFQATAAPVKDEPEAPTHPARLVDAQGARAVRIRDLSRAGGYLLIEDLFPALRERVKLEIALPGGTLSTEAEVVQQVTAAQARQWAMPAGVAIQFTDPGAAFAQNLAKLLTDAPGVQKDVAAEAEAVLRKLGGGTAGDLYTVLALPQDAEAREIRQAANAILEQLAPFREARLPRPLKERLERILERVSQARLILADPVRRAEHDGRIGNFRGVARCFSAGLRVDELEACRRRVLSEQKSPPHTAIRLASARAWEAQGARDKALAELERGLREDPLLLELHREYARLKRAIGSSSDAA